jgi:lipopolysaccharide export system protein LptA
MKKTLILLLAGGCGLAWAQTNAPAPGPPAQLTEISSDSGHFDGNTRQMIYLGHVFVTDAKTKLHCGQLIVDLPPNGGHPTNIVAETNVVIDALDDRGQTNHITADKAVYSYSVVNAVTNETITFTGSDPMPKVENPQFIILGEPLVLNLVTKQYGGSNYKTIFKPNPNSGNGTNASPFDFLK